MNNKLVILGGGESGVGAAVLAKKQGFDVFLSDSGIIQPPAKKLLKEHGVAFEEGTHTLTKMADAVQVIKVRGFPTQLLLWKT